MKLADWKLRQCDLDDATITSGMNSSIQSLKASVCPNQLRHDKGPERHTTLSQIVEHTLDENRTCPEHHNNSTCFSLLQAEPLGTFETNEITESSFRDIYRDLLRASAAGQMPFPPALLQHWKFIDGSESILHYAVKESHRATKDRLDVVRSIIETVAKEGWDIDHRDAQGRTAIELAIVSRSLPLLETVVGSGASVNHPNIDGYLPLHIAILSRSSPDIVLHLLRKGADPNATAVTRENDVETSISMPLGLVLLQLSTLSGSNERDSSSFFRIAGHLIENHAIYTPRETDLMLLQFAQAWGRNGGSQKLWEDSHPLLSALMKRGLDPTTLLNGYRFGKCECQSLVQLAFFHSRSEALGRWIINASSMFVHGSCLLQCLLHGCGDSFASKPNASNLLRVLMKRDFPITAGVSALELVLHPLAHNTWEQKAALVNTLLSLNTEHYVLQSSNRHYHSTILERVAACPFASIKCKIAEDLLQQRISSQISGGRPEDVLHHPANRPVSIYCSEATSEISCLVSQQRSSEALYESLRRSLDYQGPFQKSMLSCFVHFVTMSIIQGAESGEALPKPELYYLLELRKEFELPDIHLPNTLVLDMLKGAPEAYAKLKELEDFFTHERTSKMK